MTTLTIIGSGSAGNCAYLETDKTRLLIDAGLSARQIRQRIGMIQRRPEELTAILISHEHTDHVRGLLALKVEVPVRASDLTCNELLIRGHTSNFHSFAAGNYMEIGDVAIEAIPVPHDAVDPVGFLLMTDASTMGIVTDLGHVTKPIMNYLKLCDVLLLEANHDLRMLQDDTERPFHVKQRILSPKGHLSNDGCAEIVSQLIGGPLRHLYLGHLSQEYNRPELALRAVQNRINDAPLKIEVAKQDDVTETLTLQ